LPTGASGWAILGILRASVKSSVSTADNSTSAAAIISLSFFPSSIRSTRCSGVKVFVFIASALALRFCCKLWRLVVSSVFLLYRRATVCASAFMNLSAIFAVTAVIFSAINL
jgi:hypothetical protein